MSSKKLRWQEVVKEVSIEYERGMPSDISCTLKDIVKTVAPQSALISYHKTIERVYDIIDSKLKNQDNLEVIKVLEEIKQIINSEYSAVQKEIERRIRNR